jgi:uncharacterized phage protein (TIGR01671 family)
VREIAFRIWDKSSHAMFYFTNPHVTYGNEQVKLVLGEDFHDDFYDGKIDGPLMQYTGLQDKNGKPIYEGDIVKIPPQWPEEEPLYWSVVWEYGGSRLCAWVNGEAIGFSEPIVSEDRACELPMDIEVVGNIYEPGPALEQEEDKS